jgi:hypothetical protein
LAGGNLLAACGVKKSSGSGSKDTFTLGLVTPKTRPSRRRWPAT